MFFFSLYFYVLKLSNVVAVVAAAVVVADADNRDLAKRVSTFQSRTNFQSRKTNIASVPADKYF